MNERIDELKNGRGFYRIGAGYARLRARLRVFIRRHAFRRGQRVYVDLYPVCRLRYCPRSFQKEIGDLAHAIDVIDIRKNQAPPNPAHQTSPAMKTSMFNTLSRLAIVFLAFFFGFGHARADYVERANYAERADVAAFIQEIAARNGFDPAALTAALTRADYNPRVIDLIKPPETRITRSWERYRGRFLDSFHVHAGIRAWEQYEGVLRRAEKEYGVPPEIILGILGVETIYGRNTGNFETLSALATLAFDYPPRAELFRGELEALFLLARDQRRDPASYTGSFAGAIGWPQFLPSSIRRYAVDFNGDGRIDFDSDAEDAIGSIANYLREWGWTAHTPVAIKVHVPPETDLAPLIDAGIAPSLTPARIAEVGIRPFAGTLPAADAALIDLETPGLDTEYWLGYRNFYVITRYNRSSFYAMAVFALSRALRAEYDAPGSASHMVAKAKGKASAKKSAKATARKSARSVQRGKGVRNQRTGIRNQKSMTARKRRVISEF